MGNPNTAAEIAAQAQLKALQQIFGTSSLTQQEVTALSDFIINTVNKANKPFIRINSLDKTIFLEKRKSLFVNPLNGATVVVEYLKDKNSETVTASINRSVLNGSFALLFLEHVKTLTKSVMSNITDDNFIPKDIVYKRNDISDEPE